MSFDDLPTEEAKTRRCPKCGRPAMEYVARKEEGQVVQMEHWLCRICGNRMAPQELEPK